MTFAPGGVPKAIVTTATDDYRQCPNGHSLPHETFAGRCTPLHCADDVKALDVVPVATDESSSSDQLSKATKEAIVTSAKKQLQRRGRERLVKVPDFSSPAEAEDWVNAKKQHLTPYAIAEQEYRLLYGNDEQRDSASRLILEATGHGKRDAGMGTGATIIILGDASALRPWAAKATVDAKPATAEPSLLEATNEAHIPKNE